MSARKSQPEPAEPAVPPPTTPLAEVSATIPETILATVPATVTVVAREPLAEVIGGEVVHFAKGDQLTVPADRAAALGALVEIVP